MTLENRGSAKRGLSQSPQLTQFAVSVAAEAMFTVAPDGTILDANQAACERLEYSLEELTQMRIADIDPHYPIEQWPAHYDDLRRNGKMRFETQHRSKSGRIFDVEVSVAYFEYDGSEYCCSSVRDITQQKQAEHILRLQHDILATIASTSGDLGETLNILCGHVEEILPGALATVMVMDPSDGCLRFEAGPQLTEEIRCAFEPLVPGEAAGSCGSAAYLKKPVIVEDTRESSYWNDLQHIVDQFNLRACWSLPILDVQNNALGTFAITHQQVVRPTDFHYQILETAANLASIALRRRQSETKLRMAQEELAYINRRNTMGELASSLAHELNQPLAAIVNHAYALENESQSLPELTAVRDGAANIREQALRAGDIVRSVRNLAKRITPSRAPLCLNELIKGSMVVLEPEIRNAGITLSLELDEELPQIEADAIQVQQVLVNLVRNAIDAMKIESREKRLLTIATDRVDERAVRLRVSDTGSGLPEDTDQVFEAFHSTKPEGMGMGLTICRSIAEAHAGRLTAQANTERGATFSLSLPLDARKAG